MIDPPRVTTPGYQTQSPDTDEWAERLLFERWRRMSTREKAALVSELSASLHRLTLAGLAARFPDADERELEDRALALRYGDELAAWVRARRAEREECPPTPST